MKTPIQNKEKLDLLKVEAMDIPKALPVNPDTTSTILLTKLFLTLVITIFLFGVDVASLSLEPIHPSPLLYGELNNPTLYSFWHPEITVDETLSKTDEEILQLLQKKEEEESFLKREAWFILSLAGIILYGWVMVNARPDG